MVFIIANVEVARPVHRYASWIAKPGRGGRTPVAAVARRSRARDGGDDPRGVHLADRVAFIIDDVDVARPVHRHALGCSECGGERRVRSVQRAAEEGSSAREGGDDPRGVHLADPLVVRIADVDVARPVHRYALGVVELGLGRLTPVAAEASRSRARKSGDDPRGVHLADPLAQLLGDVEVARPVHRHVSGPVEPGRDGGDAPRGVHLADPAVLDFDDVDVARPVHRYALGRSGAGHGGDDSRGVHLADPAAHLIGEVEVARPVHG